MLTTPHLLLGAVIGKEVNNIWIVIILAIISHYLLDIIPHYKMKKIEDYKKREFKGIKIKDLVKFIEPVLGILLTIFLISINGFKMTMFAGAFFAWLPDFYTFLHWKYNLPYPLGINYIEKKLHKHTAFFIGIISQIIISIIAVYFLL